MGNLSVLLYDGVRFVISQGAVVLDSRVANGPIRENGRIHQFRGFIPVGTKRVPVDGTGDLDTVVAVHKQHRVGTPKILALKPGKAKDGSFFALVTVKAGISGDVSISSWRSGEGKVEVLAESNDGFEYSYLLRLEDGGAMEFYRTGALEIPNTAKIIVARVGEKIFFNTELFLRQVGEVQKAFGVKPIFERRAANA